jgi:D-glycero-alpha-D-manno-heptose 1-phosphate guanylyltransferase
LEHTKLTQNSEPLTCIILAGGLGTRLQSAVPDLPKCMAPINGKPFLQYLLDYLIRQEVKRFIFSLGYLNEIVIDFLETHYPSLQKNYSVEPSALGTGGAIKLACSHTSAQNLVVVNGDTMFMVPVTKLLQEHELHQTGCTLSLKPMNSFSRYGAVETDENLEVVSFREKKYYESGLINGGVYALNTGYFMVNSPDGTFSFEKDFLQKQTHSGQLRAFITDSYFIDIGIPEDYQQAAKDFRNIFPG